MATLKKSPNLKTDNEWMNLAIDAALAGGKTSPNPRVGAVIVRNQKVLATGFHRGPGSDHAEIDAFKKAKGSLKGATLYVTLEPCCHVEKRTPPCVDAIIRSGIQRVVVGRIDPNPQVQGKGIDCLKEHGIDVEVGCLSWECEALNRAYEKWIQTGFPYLILKSAMTLDGKIASALGESHWITGEESRKRVHELRSLVDGVLVGFQTAQNDDPQLTVRSVAGKNPIRIVLDSRLRLSDELHLFKNQKKTPTWIATLADQESNPRVPPLQKKGMGFIFCRSNSQGRVDLADLFSQLGKKGITSVLIEGGSTLASALIGESLMDEWWLFVAPRILGKGALDLFGELKVASLKQTPAFEQIGLEGIGKDLLMILRPKGPEVVGEESRRQNSEDRIQKPKTQKDQN